MHDRIHLPFSVWSSSETIFALDNSAFARTIIKSMAPSDMCAWISKNQTN